MIDDPYGGMTEAEAEDEGWLDEAMDADAASRNEAEDLEAELLLTEGLDAHAAVAGIDALVTEVLADGKQVVYTGVQPERCECGHTPVQHSIGVAPTDTRCTVGPYDGCAVYNPLTVATPLSVSPYGTRRSGNASTAIRLTARDVQLGKTSMPPPGIGRVLVRAFDPEAEADKAHVLFWCDRDPARAMKDALDPAKWSGTTVRRGVDCWVDSSQIVMRSGSTDFWGVYIGEPVRFGMRKPTLIPGQGLILLGQREGHWDVAYDALDHKHNDCEWGVGTRITEVPAHDVVANGLWWKWDASNKYLVGNSD